MIDRKFSTIIKDSIDILLKSPQRVGKTAFNMPEEEKKTILND